MSYCTCLKLCMLLSASSRWAISSCNLQRQTKRAGTLIFYSSSHYWDSSSLIRKKQKRKQPFLLPKKGLAIHASLLLYAWEHFSWKTWLRHKAAAAHQVQLLCAAPGTYSWGGKCAKSSLYLGLYNMHINNSQSCTHARDNGSNL